jgi:DNA (cytosine-5)-methyltransferase 1
LLRLHWLQAETFYLGAKFSISLENLYHPLHFNSSINYSKDIALTMNRRTWYQAPEDFPESDLLSPEIIELLDETKTTDGEVIGANDSVQVEGGYFLRVIHITLKNTDTIYLHGILLVPNEDIDQQYSERNGHNLKSWLPCDIQELCAIIKTETGSSDIDADLRKIPMEDVERKTNIVFTNALYPRHKADNTLVCRWKWIQKDDGKKDTEFQLRRITQAESDVDYGKSQFRLLRRARPFQPHSLRKAVGYTHADICAGGGGSARAADMAGLNIAWVLDNDPNAANTLRENFGAEKVLEEDLADLAEQRGDLLRVDVLHISFVCKPHSGLNRGTNPERDAMFVALGYTLPDILRVCKPRVVTMVSTYRCFACIFINNIHRNKYPGY